LFVLVFLPLYWLQSSRDLPAELCVIFGAVTVTTLFNWLECRALRRDLDAALDQLQTQQELQERGR
jgi:hypothetical protein